MKKNLSKLVFSSPWYFLKSVVQYDKLPESSGFEIAFIGRSNVGKSSLINAVTGQRGLARVSNTPGRTQMLNFFISESSTITIVDMPGYGYAKAPRNEIISWNQLIKDYLQGRPNLRRVYVLINSHHGLKESDRLLLDLLDEIAVSYQMVMTKADKTTQEVLKNVHNQIQLSIARRPAAHPNILVTSTLKKTGIDDLRAEIAQI